MPLLLAEGDRDAYRRDQAALEREREIMKDVKGWEVRPPSRVTSAIDPTTAGQERVSQPQTPNWHRSEHRRFVGRVP